MLITNADTISEAARPLLGIMSLLKKAQTIIDPDQLQTKLLDEFSSFELLAENMLAPAALIKQSSYILTVALDEAIMTHPNFSYQDWGRTPLAVIRYQDATGGTKIFKIVEDLLLNPQHNATLLKLVYTCLLLGFKGKYYQNPEYLNYLKLKIQDEVIDNSNVLSPKVVIAEKPPKTGRRLLQVTFVTLCLFTICSKFFINHLATQNLRDFFSVVADFKKTTPAINNF